MPARKGTRRPRNTRGRFVSKAAAARRPGKVRSVRRRAK